MRVNPFTRLSVCDLAPRCPTCLTGVCAAGALGRSQSRAGEPAWSLLYPGSRVESGPSQAERRRPRPRGRPVRVSADFHQAVELIGKRWTGAILWALSERAHYFAELTQVVPGLSDRLLSRRLRELEAEGLVERWVHDGTPA